MMDTILNFVKKLIPKKLFKLLQPVYHFLLGYIAALWYGFPSEKMIVLGVTGTTGKTTTIFLIESILKNAGYKTGYVTTAMFSDGEREWLNDKKMTMVGRFLLQKLLRKMLDNGCQVAIVETTSEGVVQFRHRFINYDKLLFTGIFPEHIESHGSFENYKMAKGKLFAHLENCRPKNINSCPVKSATDHRASKLEKTIIVNHDDAYANYFLDFWADKKIQYGEKNDTQIEMLVAKDITSRADGISFSIDGVKIDMQIVGRFNVGNALAAAAVASSFDISMEKIKAGLEKIQGIPGRLEKIDAGQNFMVIVDYAFEPNAVAKLYETVKNIVHNKIIHVLGSTGGGRDKARRPKLGKLADENADFVIVTNEDPYDEDPMQIIAEVAAAVEKKKEQESFWKILDRREAIQKALSLAQANDIVLVTGKGSEQAMCVADGKKIFWDDRTVIREELAKLK
jgi:UDP-N-acetylmuramoyl-L-alanyl-D-glutamate--2,6-diaminopimelate ligase